MEVYHKIRHFICLVQIYYIIRKRSSEKASARLSAVLHGITSMRNAAKYA